MKVAILGGTKGMGRAVARLMAGRGMVTHRVRLGEVDGVDDELIGWLREAYERA